VKFMALLQLRVCAFYAWARRGVPNRILPPSLSREGRGLDEV